MAREARSGPLLIVVSPGGHLLQMLELRAAWEGFPRLWVTMDKSDARSLLKDEKVIYGFGPMNRNAPEYRRNLLRNLRLAVRVLRSLRPGMMISTGSSIAVPFAWLARLMGVPVVYVESLTRIEGLSVTGRMIAPIAEQLYVQWPELAARLPRAQYAGHVLGEA